MLPWELRRLGNTSSIRTLKYFENLTTLIKYLDKTILNHLAIAKKQKSAVNVLLFAPTFVKKFAPEFANSPAKSG